MVLSSPSSHGPPPVLTPNALVEAIIQRPFVIFSIIYLVAAIILGGLSEGSLGRRVVAVDVGLCAIFGRASWICAIRSRVYSLGRWLYGASDESDLYTSDKGMGEDGDRMDYVPHPSSQPSHSAYFSALIAVVGTCHHRCPSDSISQPSIETV